MSQTPGSHSYPLSLDRSAAAKALNRLCQQSRLSRIFSALGEDADLHIVGGAVRDTLLGKDNVDIDLATKLRPDEVNTRLTKAAIRTIPTGIKHGTISAHIDGENFEITTFRKRRRAEGESPYADSIAEDLAGRDFTINAIAYSTITHDILDPLLGIQHLIEGQVVAIGNPQDPFIDDPLRLLRAVRFGPAAGRTIETRTAAACKENALLIGNVSPERVRDELSKILLSPLPGAGLKGLVELQLLPLILPELIPSIGFEQNDFHRFDVFEHTTHVVENAPNDLTLRLAALFHDIGKPHTLSVDDDGRRHFYKHEIVSASLTRAALERLRYSYKQIGEVISLVRHHMRPMDVGKPGLRRLQRDLGELLEPWLTLKRADSLAAKITPAQFDAAESKFRALMEEERSRESLQSAFRLAITGDDLIAHCGMKEGPLLGKVLAALHEAVLENPEMNTPDSLFALAKKLGK